MKRVRKTVIGLDVGTTTVKAVLVSDNGDVLSVSNIGQSVSVPRPGWTEQDPRIWWKSAVSAIQKILNKSPLSHLANVSEVHPMTFRYS